MSEVTLRADTGRQLGSRSSRRLRRDGMVPATVYGKDSDPLSVSVNARDLRRILGTDAGLNAIISLEVGSDTHTALARELQRHPVRGDIIHLDFVKISLTDRVDAVVFIDFTGDPVGVRDEGGIVETVTTSVNVQAVVTNIPDSIELDISDLNVGDSLKVSDLPDLEGVEYMDDEDLTLATVVLPAAMLADEEEDAEEGELEEGEEGAEGEDGEGAEGGEDDGGGE